IAIACKRQSKIPPDKLSISESTPNPISATLDAKIPAPTATAASARFQHSVTYSSRLPAARSPLSIVCAIICTICCVSTTPNCDSPASRWLARLGKLLQSIKLSAKHAFYGRRDLLEPSVDEPADVIRELDSRVVGAVCQLPGQGSSDTRRLKRPERS